MMRVTENRELEAVKNSTDWEGASILVRLV
jgi:hypothetical protein